MQVPDGRFKLRKHWSVFKVSIWLTRTGCGFTVAQQPVICTRFLFTTSHYTGNLRTLFSVKNIQRNQIDRNFPRQDFNNGGCGDGYKQ